MKKLLISGLLAASTSVLAAPPSLYVLSDGGSSTHTSNRGYIGLSWVIGTSLKPSVVLGFARAKVDTSGDVNGANLSLSIDFTSGVNLSKAKLDYINGKDSRQGAIGVGYNLSKSSPFIGAGLNSSHANVGADFLLNGQVEPSFTIHSLGKFDKPNASSCDLFEGDYFDISGTAYTDSECTQANTFF